MSMTTIELWHEKQRRVEAFDLEGRAALFAKDGVMEHPLAPDGMPRRLVGREEIRRVLSGAAAMAVQSGVRLVGHHSLVIHQTADPEVVVAEFVAVGESPTGRHEVPYLQVFQARDGEIVLFRDYWSIDSAGALFGEATAAAMRSGTGSP